MINTKIHILQPLLVVIIATSLSGIKTPIAIKIKAKSVVKNIALKKYLLFFHSVLQLFQI